MLVNLCAVFTFSDRVKTGVLVVEGGIAGQN